MFENLQAGVKYYIPSLSFLDELRKGKIFWFQNMNCFKKIEMCEWYNEENKKYLIYFDNWDDLLEKLKNNSEEKADVSWFGFLVTLRDGVSFKKSALIDHLEAAKIQTRSYFTGNALFHPAYQKLAKDYKDPAKQFPIATKSTKDTFFVGVWPGMTDEQMDYIQTVLQKFCWKYKISVRYDER